MIPDTYQVSPRARTLALWVVLLAFFMDLLDSTIVNVALPSIQASLHTDYAAIQWTIAGYALTFAVFLITGGRLGDIFGHRRMFLAGMAGFTAASACCGFATSIEALIASRFFQGAMAALMVPQILAIVQLLYPPQERSGISAMYGALAGIATISGPILGALLISANVWGLDWRAIFLVNIPVGIAALALGARYVPKLQGTHSIRLDLSGVALVFIAMVLLMFPLIQGRELGWPAWCALSIAASFALFGVFAWTQLRKEQSGGSPLVAPALFRLRSFVTGNVVAGGFFAVVTGFFLMLVLFLQIGLHYSPLRSGLTGIPFSIGVSSAAALTGGVLVPRFGRRVLSVGPLLMACGFAGLIATVQHFGQTITSFHLIPALVVSGLGMGGVVASIVVFTLADVPLREAGSASGVINAVDQVGGALGVALMGGLFISWGAAHGDFQTAFVRTLWVSIALLVAISAATLFLPLRPRAWTTAHPAEDALASEPLAKVQ